ncbi:hypothetical protein LSAT2_015444, partial [Lamellibrachia satsuma]
MVSSTADHDGEITLQRRQSTSSVMDRRPATSNFHESSHGKGIPDGVGATVNRLADAAVLGKDTENASSLLENVWTVIPLHLVPVEEVSSATEKLQRKCKLVYPVHYKVLRYGNCLPRSGSVLAFGHENFADEIRARLIIELVLNEYYYLNGSFLRQGGEFDDKAA